MEHVARVMEVASTLPQSDNLAGARRAVYGILSEGNRHRITVLTEMYISNASPRFGVPMFEAFFTAYLNDLPEILSELDKDLDVPHGQKDILAVIALSLLCAINWDTEERGIGGDSDKDTWFAKKIGRFLGRHARQHDAIEEIDDWFASQLSNALARYLTFKPNTAYSRARETRAFSLISGFREESKGSSINKNTKRINEQLLRRILTAVPLHVQVEALFDGLRTFVNRPHGGF